MGKPILPPGLQCGVAKPTAASGCCTRCSYDLTGLQMGGCCPECGSTITLRRGEGTLGQAPDKYLAPLGYWAWSVAAGYTGLWIVVVALLIYDLTRGLGSGMVVGIAWVPSLMLAAGAWGVSRPRFFADESAMVDPDREWRVLRWMLRIGSIMVVVAVWFAIAVVQNRATPIVNTSLWRTFYFASFGGGIGVMLLFAYVSLLAAWGEDDGLVGRCRAVPWVLVVSLLPFVVAVDYTAKMQIGFVSYFIARIAWALTMLALGFGSLALCQFALHVGWARANARVAAGSGSRRHDRIMARIRDGQARPEQGGVPPVATPTPAKPQGHYLAGSEGKDAYEIAETGESGTTIVP